MLETTLCYITRGDAVLMLYRNRKPGDVNAGKWIGVGGKLLPGEHPDQGMLREVYEETGFQLTRWASRGIVEFRSEDWMERMYLYTAQSPDGTLAACDEGELAFVPMDRVSSLPLWEGDRVFLRLLRDGEPFFRLELVYRGEKLISAVLNGEAFPI